MFGVFDETVVQAQPAEGDFLDEVREGHCQPDGRAVKIFPHGRFRGHDVDFPLICVEIRIFRNVNIIDDERVFVVAIDERRVPLNNAASAVASSCRMTVVTCVDMRCPQCGQTTVSEWVSDTKIAPVSFS